MAEPSIVVVEDEQIVSKDIQSRLARFGYEIAGVTASGEAAVDLVEKTHPDLVLMDVMLKGNMTGTEAAEIIRKRFGIPVVYLTAYADRDTLDRAKITEPYGYVLKPFDERELRTAIEMALHKHKAEQENMRLKEQLMQVQKLEAIGHLTTGVTHNFNNALNVIVGNLELARMQTRDEQIWPFLERALKASQSAARVIDGLLTFCRERERNYKVFDIRGVVQQAVDMCHQLLKGEVRLDLHLPEHAQLVRGDSNQIQQAVLNLCLNARDALEDLEDGRLPYIEVGVDQILHDDSVFIRIQVEDNGIGMSETVQQHIFEPFFTTKSVDRGTGLGLSTVFGIVQDHDGWIDCKSRVGVGTTFSVFFPIAMFDMVQCVPNDEV